MAEIHNYIHSSSKRTVYWESLQILANQSPVMMLGMSKIRWLSAVQGIKRGSQRLPLLKIFFQVENSDGRL